MDHFLPFLLMLLFVALATSSGNKKRRAKEEQVRRKYMEHMPLVEDEEADAEEEDEGVFVHEPLTSPSDLAPLPLERAPLLRASLAPTPHDHSDMFAGSLNADNSGEGSDPHDHGFTGTVVMPSHTSDQAINASLLAADDQPTTRDKGLLDFSGDALVRAFVMQEVLGKPGGMAEEIG